MSLVLDASMAISWLFRDERTARTQAVLGGAVAPSIWCLEVANVLRNAVRRRRCDEAYATHCLLRLGRLRVAVDGETDRHAWGATRELSRQHDLTLYDAAYLELAVRLNRTLASRDAALLKAARSVGIKAIGD